MIVVVMIVFVYRLCSEFVLWHVLCFLLQIPYLLAFFLLFFLLLLMIGFWYFPRPVKLKLNFWFFFKNSSASFFFLSPSTHWLNTIDYQNNYFSWFLHYVFVIILVIFSCFQCYFDYFDYFNCCACFDWLFWLFLLYVCNLSLAGYHKL